MMHAKNYKVSATYVKKDLSACFPKLKSEKNRPSGNEDCLKATILSSVHLSSTDCANDKKSERAQKNKKERKRHICPYCNKSILDLKVHVRIHTGEKPYICAFCERGFTHSGSRILHEKRHIRENPFICDYCSKSFAEIKSKIFHERIHVGEKFTCGTCGRGFSRYNDKLSHEKFHTSFNIRSDRRHLKTLSHLITKGVKETIQLSNETPVNKISTEENSCTCIHCGKAFIHSSIKESQGRQLIDDRPSVCDDCQKMFTENSKKEIPERISTNKESFNDSSKSAIQVRTTKEHEKTLSGERHDVHSKKKKSDKKNHRKEKRHDSSRNYKKSSSHYRENEGHERVDDFSYECRYCGRTFRYSRRVKRHERRHSKRHPYPCDYCESRFAYVNNKIRHEKRHRKLNYTCNICGRGFAEYEQMNDHKALHAEGRLYSKFVMSHTFREEILL